MINRLTGISAFFLYGGYYAFLLLLYNYQVVDSVGTIYSMLVRAIAVFILFILSVKLFSNRFKVLDVTVLFLLISFSVLYCLKVLFFEDLDALYSRNQYLLYFLSYCFLPFFLISFIDMEKIYDNFFDWIQISNFVFLVFSITYYGKYLFQDVIRLNSSIVGTGEQFVSPLVLSYISSLAISMAFVNILIKIHQRKYNILIIFLAIPSFFLGASRGSILVLLCTALIILLLTDFKVRIRFLLGAFAFSLIMYFVSSESSSSVFLRFLNITEDVSNNSDSAIRLIMWRSALDEFKHNALFGGAVELNGIYPHNIYIEALMSTGILGFTCLVSSILLVFYKILFLIKKDKKYALLLVVFSNGLIQYFFSGALYYSILIFTMMGVTLGIHISYKRND